MDKGIDNEYKMLALKTVIKWCREQGVKIYLSDFNYNNVIYVGGKKTFHTDITCFCEQVSVFIDYKGSWKEQLSKKKENFLNYLNVRVTGKGIYFNFTYKELDFIKLSDMPVSGDDKKLDDDKIKKIIEKINKLLALADLEKNPSEHEAISASLKVQKLLAEYNLSMEEVTGESNEEKPMEQVIADVGKGSKSNWKDYLAVAVANGYVCKSFRQGESVVFFGYEADVLLARRIFVYLYNVGNKLGNQYVSQNMGEVSDHTLYQSFVMGFVNGVQTQLEKQCTALALVIQPEVEEKWSEFSEDFVTRRQKRKSIEGKAYKEGLIEGKRVFNAQYIE